MLDNTDIGDAGATLLADVLKSNTAVKTLSLGNLKPIVVIFISPLKPMLKATMMLLRYSVQLLKVKLATLMVI